jgi:hypothetical protein
VAIATYCLVSKIAKDLKIKNSIYEILQILFASLIDKATIYELLIKSDYNNVNKTILIIWFSNYFNWTLVMIYV